MHTTALFRTIVLYPTVLFPNVVLVHTASVVHTATLFHVPTSMFYFFKWIGCPMTPRSFALAMRPGPPSIGVRRIKETLDIII